MFSDDDIHLFCQCPPQLLTAMRLIREMDDFTLAALRDRLLKWPDPVLCKLIEVHGDKEAMKDLAARMSIAAPRSAA